MKEKILITGGAGFIGSHLCELLVLNGHPVVAIDNLTTGRLENIAHLLPMPGFHFVRENITNSQVSPCGSDWSVSTADPFEEMETAITRMDALDGTTTPWMPAERIGLPEALAAFTINAAYTNRDEQNTGSLEVGKRANPAVLDRNLFEIPATDICDTQVLLTLFEGKPVHGDPGSL